MNLGALTRVQLQALRVEGCMLYADDLTLAAKDPAQLQQNLKLSELFLLTKGYHKRAEIVHR